MRVVGRTYEGTDLVSLSVEQERWHVRGLPVVTADHLSVRCCALSLAIKPSL